MSDGEMSPPFFPIVLNKIFEALPHAERKTFTGAGHVPHISHPGDYVKTLTDFISRNN